MCDIDDDGDIDIADVDFLGLLDDFIDLLDSIFGCFRRDGKINPWGCLIVTLLIIAVVVLLVYFF